MANVYLYSIVANGIIFVGFILAVVGTATDGWATFAGHTGGGLPDGQDYPTGQAAYAMCVLCTLFAAGALVAVCVDVYLQYSGKINESTAVLIPRVVCVAGIAGGFFGIVGAIIHAAWMATEAFVFAYSPGYSWYLTVVGSLGLITGGALDFQSRRSRQIELSSS